jgi:hypothetical protein
MIHIRITDVLDRALRGTPLPCSCDACREKAERWAADRNLPRAFADDRPPGFWAGREAAIGALAAPRPHRALCWAFGAAAALAVLACALFLFARPSRETRWRRFETQIPAVQEALNRPALGDLESCSVVLYESVETSEEESL